MRRRRLHRMAAVNRAAIAIAQAREVSGTSPEHIDAEMAARRAEEVSRARRSGYQNGYMDGVTAGRAMAGHQQQAAGGFSYADIESARASGYAAGAAAAASNAHRHAPSTPDVASVRAKLISEMEEQCRVIAESNPGMAPGVKAVKRQIGKLKKK